MKMPSLKEMMPRLKLKRMPKLRMKMSSSLGKMKFKKSKGY